MQLQTFFLTGLWLIYLKTFIKSERYVHFLFINEFCGNDAQVMPIYHIAMQRLFQDIFDFKESAENSEFRDILIFQCKSSMV